MKKANLRLIVAMLTVLFLAVVFTAAADDAKIKIRVTVTIANVRLKPGLDSSIIATAKKGQTFDVVQKTGDWYLVNLPPDDKGVVISGYINKIVAEEIGGEEAREEPKAKTPDRVKTEPPPPPPAQKKPAAQIRPPVAAAAAAERGWNKFYVRLGGGYASKKYSYDNAWTFDAYYEEAQVTENYDIDGTGFSFDGGIGFFFMKNLGLEASVTPSSGKTTGTFSSDIPHPFYFNNSRTADWTDNNLKYSALEINLDLIFRISLFSNMFFYAGGGGTYFMDVKIDNMKQLTWSETGYPYLEVSVTPEYASYKASTFGFNACGGFDYFIMKNVGLNVNVRYSSGSAEIDVEGTKLTIKPGGIKALGGIKFVF